MCRSIIKRGVRRCQWNLCAWCGGSNVCPRCSTRWIDRDRSWWHAHRSLHDRNATGNLFNGIYLFRPTRFKYSWGERSPGTEADGNATCRRTTGGCWYDNWCSQFVIVSSFGVCWSCPSSVWNGVDQKPIRCADVYWTHARITRTKRADEVVSGQRGR